MHKILLVDDEMNTRRHLRLLMDYEQEGCFVAGEAQNYEEALLQMERLHPEILLCDIEMPGKSGLDLAARVRKTAPGTRIIFLTGHDKFAYAQQAIQSGADEYILKPVDPTELRSALARTVCALERQKTLEEEHHLFRHMLETSKDELRERFLSQILFLPPAPKEVERKIEFFNLVSARYQVAVLEVGPYPGPESSEYHHQSALYTLKNLLLDQLRPHMPAYLLEVGIDRYLAVLMPQPEEQVLSALEKAIGVVEDLLGLTVSCGVSECFSALERMRFYYYQAAKACSHTCYVGAHSVISYQNLAESLSQAPQKPDYSADAKQVAEYIRRAVVLGGGLEQLLADILSGPAYRSRAVEEAKACYIEFTVTLFKTLELWALISPKDQAITSDMYARIITLRTAEDVAKQLAQTVCRLVGANQDSNIRYFHCVVDEALAYIRETYPDNITLGDVAGRVHVNTSYLSRIIKKVTGKNFVDILLQARIAKARELLQDSSLKVYEVAERVGIPETKYFSSVFKKETGLTPTEYRNSLSL